MPSLGWAMPNKHPPPPQNHLLLSLWKKKRKLERVIAMFEEKLYLVTQTWVCDIHTSFGWDTFLLSSDGLQVHYNQGVASNLTQAPCTLTGKTQTLLLYEQHISDSRRLWRHLIVWFYLSDVWPREGGSDMRPPALTYVLEPQERASED